MLNKIKNILKKELRASSIYYYKKSYSQCGEDILMNYVLELRGIKNPTYIDVGANNPYFLNNTGIFYKRGCKGINVDANPFLIKKFNRKRNRDININIGIGKEDSEMDFYIMKDDTLSTFSKSEYDILQSNGHQLSQVKKLK